MGRKRKIQLKSDEELQLEGKNRQYDRQQKLQDALNKIVIWVIYISPVALALLAGLIVTGQVLHFNTTTPENWLTHLITALAAYFFGYLQKNGLKKTA
jgi:hypothetical protein